jgi:hypothetical protein
MAVTANLAIGTIGITAADLTPNSPTAHNPLAAAVFPDFQMPIPPDFRRDGPLVNAIERVAAYGVTATPDDANRPPR